MVAQCSNITNIVLFLKRVLHDFSFFPLSTSNVGMSEGTFCRIVVHIVITICIHMHKIQPGAISISSTSKEGANLHQGD